MCVCVCVSVCLCVCVSVCLCVMSRPNTTQYNFIVSCQCHVIALGMFHAAKYSHIVTPIIKR